MGHCFREVKESFGFSKTNKPKSWKKKLAHPIPHCSYWYSCTGKAQTASNCSAEWSGSLPGASKNIFTSLCIGPLMWVALHSHQYIAGIRPKEKGVRLAEKWEIRSSLRCLPSVPLSTWALLRTLLNLPLPTPGACEVSHCCYRVCWSSCHGQHMQHMRWVQVLHWHKGPCTAAWHKFWHPKASKIRFGAKTRKAWSILPKAALLHGTMTDKQWRRARKRKAIFFPGPLPRTKVQHAEIKHWGCSFVLIRKMRNRKGFTWKTCTCQAIAKDSRVNKVGNLNMSLNQLQAA